jgi:hypothetical protein
MDLASYMLPDICTEIQAARDFQAVTEIWHENLPFLYDCKLIYSHPDESDTIMPSKAWPRNFPKGGFLRPLFAHDNLHFLNRRIVEDQILNRESPLQIDITVEFDTNVASYVEGFVENRANSNKERVSEALHFIITTERAKFGYNFYLLENAQGFYDGSRVPSIRRNLRSIKKLNYLDKEKYQATGEIRATLADSELDIKANEKLQELYDSTYKEGLTEEFLPMNEMLYLILLKVVEIEHRGERRKLDLKMEELYQFMHFELKTMFVREAIIALNYFRNRSSLTFFGKINPKPKERGRELLKDIKNMSWDLMLFRMMERIATLPGQGDFLIPYFLSFDRKMVQLFDLFPLKAILAHSDSPLMIPLWETSPLKELQKEIDIEIINDYFTETARNIRYSEREATPRPDFGDLRNTLEQDVLKLLTC